MSRSFAIEYTHLFHFCKCAEKLVAKGSPVSIRSVPGRVLMVVSDGCSVVEYRGAVKNEGEFDAWVSLDKLSLIYKKLYDGLIHVKESKSKLIIEEDNIKAKIPLMEARREDLFEPLANPVVISKDKACWLVGLLKECNSSVPDVDKFKGILVDSSSDILRICKFSQSTIAIANGPERVFNEGRFIVSSKLVDSVTSFVSQVDFVLICGNLFGFRLESGVSIYSSILEDCLPQNYLDSLKLKDDWMLVDQEGLDRYVFNRDELLAALDVVMGVASSDRSFVSMKALGNAKGSEGVVWSVYCKDSSGCEIEECIKCLEFKSSQRPKFGLNGRSFINSLKTRGETVVLYNKESSPVMLSDTEGGRLTLLIKTME